MKKVLIASTALVAAGLLTTGTASASEKIKLNLGGFSKWWVVGAWNDASYEASAAAGTNDYNTVDIKGDNEIFFGGSTTLDNGLKVGVDVQLEAGGGVETQAGNTTTGDVIDESYAWIEGGFGKVIIGSENNGTYLLHVTAPEPTGNWNDAGIMTADRAIARPTNVTTMGGGNTTAINTDGDAEKITYVAPSFYGLTVGGSYVPNATEDNNSPTRAQEIYGVGALYANTFGGVGVKVSVGGIMGDIAHAGTSGAATTAKRTEYAAGTQLSYAGFTVGGSYRAQQDDFTGEMTNGAAAYTADGTGHAWDAGISYASGPYAIGFTYFNSQVRGAVNGTVAASAGDDEITFYQLSGKYNLGTGVDVLAAVGHADYSDEATVTTTNDGNNNEGWVVMTGLSLAF